MAWEIPNEADAPVATVQSRLFNSALDDLVKGLGGTGVVSGGGVTYTSGSVYDIAAGVALIGGVQVPFNATTKSISYSGTPHLDVITVNSSGTVTLTAGTAAAAPVEAESPAGEAKLAVIYVESATYSSTRIQDRRVFVVAQSSSAGVLIRDRAQFI